MNSDESSEDRHGGPLVEPCPILEPQHKKVIMGITICPPHVKNYVNLLSFMQVRRLKLIFKAALKLVPHDSIWIYKQVFEYHKNGIVHSHIKLTSKVPYQQSTVGLVKDIYKAISYAIMKTNKCKCIIDEHKHWYDKYNRITSPQVCIQVYDGKSDPRVEEWDKYLEKDSNNGLN